MTQQGEHTWDLHVDYRRCPECGFINENRLEDAEGYACQRCAHKFSLPQKAKKGFAPLFGKPQPPEFDWK